MRRHDKYKIWLGVGGHIELDEDPNQAALREVKEEVGLAVSYKSNKWGRPKKQIDVIKIKELYQRLDSYRKAAAVYNESMSKSDRISYISVRKILKIA